MIKDFSCVHLSNKSVSMSGPSMREINGLMERLESGELMTWLQILSLDFGGVILDTLVSV